MSLRTDMAVELRQQNAKVNGITHEESQVADGINLTKICIESDETAKKLNRQKGDYITISIDEVAEDDAISNLLNEILGEMLPDDGLVLVVGLGNKYITPDSLGPTAAIKINATRHISETLRKSFEIEDLRDVAVIAPGVLGQTGIETFEIIKAVCNSINPIAVLIIDALAAQDYKRIGKSLQITDTGIHPGSGVNGSRAEISQKTLGIKTIAVGVPCVIDAYNLVHDFIDESREKADINRYKNLIVAPTNIDEINEKWAEIIAHGVNTALSVS